MITQKFKNGTSEITVETAESILDAQKNCFPDKVFSRYYVNGKPVAAYSDVINHIVSETRKGGSFQMPTNEELREKQKEIVVGQKKMIMDHIEQLKKSYEGISIPKEVLDQFDRIIQSIDLAGVRVAE